MLNCNETSVPFYFVEITFEYDCRPYDVLMEILKYLAGRSKPFDEL